MRTKPSLRRVMAGSVAVATLISVALAAPLLRHALRLAEEREAALLRPIAACDEEMVALTRVLFRDWEFAGIAPPPAEPGEPPAPPQVRQTVLLDTSVAFCDVVPKAPEVEPTCESPLLEEAIGSFAFDDQVPRRLRQELLLANRKSVAMPDADIPNVIRVSRAQLDRSFDGGNGWPGFYSAFPQSNGSAALSRAVLSQDRSHALLYASHRCGGVCGAGYLHYLARRDGSWRIIDSIMVWDS